MKRTLPLFALLALSLPLAACGGGGHGDSSSGVVGRLTGDPDDEVARDLEVLVDKALARTTSDEPIGD